jgi:hypothetical protein
LLLEIGIDALRWDGMLYGSDKKGLVVAAVGALMLATLVSLSAVYGLSRPLDPDELPIVSAAPHRRP